jgi:hypothetical protein
MNFSKKFFLAQKLFPFYAQSMRKRHRLRILVRNRKKYLKVDALGPTKASAKPKNYSFPSACVPFKLQNLDQKKLFVFLLHCS